MSSLSVPYRLPEGSPADLAAALARYGVRAAESLFGLQLDHSVASLELLDGALDELANAGLSDDERQQLLTAWGCYLGEVVVQKLEGEWQPTAHVAATELTPEPLMVVFTDGSFCRPLEEVRHRSAGGGQSLGAFYHTLEKTRGGTAQ